MSKTKDRLGGKSRVGFDEVAGLSPIDDAEFRANLKSLSARKYQNVLGYAPPSELVTLLGRYGELTSVQVDKLKNVSIRETWLISRYLLSEVCPMPFYWLGNDLTRALWDSKIDLDFLVPVDTLFCHRFALMLPEGVIPSPEGGHIKFISTYVVREGLTALAVAEGLGGEGDCIYHGQLMFETDMSNIRSQHLFSELEADFDETCNFVDRIKGFCYQVLLLGQVRPDLFQKGRDDEVLQAASRRKVTRRLKSPQPFRPNWLGLTYRMKRYEASQPAQGCHASPRLHLRKGHWRSQPYGSRKNPQYRPKWIEPMVIGAKQFD